MTIFRILALAAVFSLSTAALAEPTIDLVPQSLTFAKRLDDDVSMSYSQHVSIKLKNQGNVTWHNRNYRMSVSLDGRTYQALIYGNPNGLLGGAIAPGQLGSAFFRLPLGTLRHCQSVGVRIDLARNQQVGYDSVFANDAKRFAAIDLQAITVCPIVRQ